MVKEDCSQLDAVHVVGAISADMAELVRLRTLHSPSDCEHDGGHHYAALSASLASSREFHVR